MRRSQVISVVLFFVATSFAAPMASSAGTAPVAANMHTSDPEPRSYNTHNLGKKDGFDADAHRAKLKNKPKAVRQTKSDRPLDKHNL